MIGLGVLLLEIGNCTQALNEMPATALLKARCSRLIDFSRHEGKATAISVV
jgi:hypothetical protein